MVALAALSCPGPASAGTKSEPAPFGHPCRAEHGVRFCPTETLAQRVPSFDGVPLDVDVTLPPSGSGPFPTIVMMHGWGGNKATFEATSPSGNGNETFDYNNIYYAQQGYAVVSYSARGWGNSCGNSASRAGTPGCDEGWVRLADQRYEVRDTQTLLGELVDEHVAKRGRLGVTGGSYGGGQSIELAYLKNRIRLPDGEFAPWTSPAGRKLAITAAYARVPFSDLVDALLPNGRFLDGEIAPSEQSREPLGVAIQSNLSLLKLLAGYIAPTGKDPEAEPVRWFNLFNAGEPYTAEVEGIANQIYTYHQAYGLPGKPAPMLLESGWTDDLVPPEQSLRVYNAVRARHGKVALQLGDLGHSRGANKEDTLHAFQEQAASFFAAELKHEGEPPAWGSVTAYTQTCPTAAPGGGPFTAASFSALHSATITVGSAAPQSFTSAGGSAAIAKAFDPAGGTTDACKTVKGETEANTANYTTTSPGFTLMGMPTVTATVNTVGQYGEIAARLWDVLANGEQRLISRGIYRLTEDQQGTITFQLHGNAYEFAPGDTVELQLLGRDAPYYRASNGSFTVEVSNLTASLPTA